MKIDSRESGITIGQLDPQSLAAQNVGVLTGSRHSSRASHVACLAAQDCMTRIRPIEICAPPGIECAFGCVESDGDEKAPKILVVAFRGEYPDGSAGNPHGHFIAYSTVLGIASFEPWCLILDFRDLTYRWGNTLLLVFDHVSRFMNAGGDSQSKFPIAVVTSHRCRDGFLSLISRPGDAPPDWHFDDMSAAIKHAIREAHGWINA